MGQILGRMEGRDPLPIDTVKHRHSPRANFAPAGASSQYGARHSGDFAAESVGGLRGGWDLFEPVFQIEIMSKHL